MPSPFLHPRPRSESLKVKLHLSCQLTDPESIPIFFFVVFITAALAQDDRGQFESVQLLSDRRNMTIVRTCPLVLVNRLSCNLTSVMDDRLIIQDQVFLTIIDIRIRTCNSSLWPVFTFSNGTVVDNAADYLQCSRKIPLGQLTIMFGLNVRFMNETSRLIVIDTSVSARDH